MQTYVILLPRKQFIEQVFSLRNNVVDRGFGKKDARRNVLPHVTLVYFEEHFTNKKIDKCIRQLDKISFSELITLDITKITVWEHKVVAKFDTSPLDNIKAEIEKLLGNAGMTFNTEYRKLYGNTVGNHMKLARQVLPDKVEETKDFFKTQLPRSIQFERLALIGYKGRETDILWQRNFLT